MRRLLSIVLLAGGILTAQDADTQRLARDLRGARGQLGLTPPQVKSIREQLLAWTDTRLRQGLSIDELNRQLAAARLFAPDSLYKTDDIYQPFAGYLEDITISDVPGAPDWMLVNLAIGMTCAFDQTAVLYQRNPLKRIGWIHFNDSEGTVAWGLSAISAGPPDGKGERILAAAFMSGWCTSGYGGIEARIWKVTDVMRPVLIRAIGLRRDYPVTAEVADDTVSFHYSSTTFDFEATFVQPRIQRFRIEGYHAERIPPYAVTILGAIDHWLETDGAAANKWMDDQKGLERVTNVTRCPGTPRLWQIQVRPWESEDRRFFIVEENGAENLRVIGFRTQPMRSCPSIDKKEATVELSFTP